MSVQVWIIVAAVAVLAVGFVVRSRSFRSWYDRHTTPKERLIVDEVARAGLAAAEKALPALDSRVSALEGAIAALQAAGSAPSAAADPTKGA